MPRKTNKTARVLNLLSNGTGTSDIETEQPQAAPAEKTTSKPAAANIQFMPSPTSSGDSLAGLIKESLDKEISKYHAENESAGKEIINEETSFNAPPPVMEPAVSEDMAATPENANESIVSKPAEAAPITPEADAVNIGIAETGTSESEPEISIVETVIPASPVPSAAESSASMVSDATLAAVNAVIDTNPVPMTINAATEAVINSPATTTNDSETAITPSATAAPETATISPVTTAAAPEAASISPAAATAVPEAASISPATTVAAPIAAIIPPVTTTAPEPVQEEFDYLYINVMEHLLEERQIEFMNRFDVCTCDRCVLDIKALAMTNLPSKYMVMPRANISPMMNYFRSKYNINIVTEVTKACLEIFNHPRH